MNRIAIIAIAAIALGACGDDPGTTPATTASATPQAASAERYCALAAGLDRSGSAFFAELEGDPDAGPHDYRRAERSFVEQHTADLDALAQAAPEEIREDVALVLAGMRERAGLDPGMELRGQGAAERRVRRFERRSC